MPDQMKVGQMRYVQNPEIYAHIKKIPLKPEQKKEKSGKGNGYLTGFLEKLPY